MLLSLSVPISQNTEKVVLPVGHTIDYDFSEEERCPHCSGQIYHIHEDNHIVYCVKRSRLALILFLLLNVGIGWSFSYCER